MPEEIETDILELQGREEPEEMGEVQDELTGKGKSTNENQGLIDEVNLRRKSMSLLLWLKRYHDGYMQPPIMGEYLG